MGGMEILEVVIGLVFIYLVLSLVCTAFNEIVVSWLAVRASVLRKGIENILGDKNGSFTEEFYEQPLIRVLRKPRTRWIRRWKPKDPRDPSHIPANAFAETVINHFLGVAREQERARKKEEAEGGASGEPGAAEAEGGAEAHQDPTLALLSQAVCAIATESADDSKPWGKGLAEALNALLPHAQGKLDRFREKLEGWFDDAMARVTGWYRRRTQLVSVLLGLLITLALDADFFKMSHILWHVPATRAALVEMGAAAVERKVQTEDKPAAAGAPGPEAVGDDETTLGDSPDRETAGTAQPTATANEEARAPTGDVMPSDEQAQSPETPGTAANSGVQANRELALKGLKELTEQELLGWSSDPFASQTWKKLGAGGTFVKLLGFLISVLAISLGAPFWFDLLGRFVSLRAAVRKVTPGQREKPGGAGSGSS